MLGPWNTYFIPAIDAKMAAEVARMMERERANNGDISPPHVLSLDAAEAYLRNFPVQGVRIFAVRCQTMITHDAKIVTSELVNAPDSEFTSIRSLDEMRA